MCNDFDAIVNDAENTAKDMQGWDFSYVRGRRHTDRHSWDYTHTVCSMLEGIHDMLDMDTGGGEVLLGLKKQARIWPDRVCATEGYEPNVAVAIRNLRPIGVEVFGCRSNDSLPFEDESFDLITNRHGDYSVQEIRRVLKPQGVFVTQQIGFGVKTSFNELLDGPDPSYERRAFAEIASRFEDCSFDILDQQTFSGRDVFDDIGAVVFVLTAAPWEVPGFSVARYRDKLHTLHESMVSNGPIDVGISFYLLVAQKRSSSGRI